MKIIITGGTGFVGNNLQNYLTATYEIETMSVRYEHDQQFDIKADIVIHLAGKAHDLKKVSKHAKRNYLWQNYQCISYNLGTNKHRDIFHKIHLSVYQVYAF